MRLRCIFKIRLPKHGDDWLLAFVEMTTPVDSGHAEECSQLVRVLKTAPKAGETTRTTGYWVIDVATIEGAAHLIPDYDNVKYEIEKGYVVNSHIDLKNWNTVYDWEEDDSDSDDKAENPANRARKTVRKKESTAAQTRQTRAGTALKWNRRCK